MSEILRFGIVGLGRAGWDIHVQQVRIRPDARVVAVAEPVPERRQQAADELGCRTYDSLGALLDDRQVDVVVIASPSHLHASETIRAVRAGKHVICEKPMATRLADADEMIAAAEQAGRLLFVHHQHRFSREYTHLQHMIASGRLGRIFHIRTTATSFARRNDWQCLSKYGGGQLSNVASHLIDMILPLMGGTITSVWGDLQQIASAGDVEDHVKVLMRSDNGCTADIEVSWAEAVATPLPRWILCGTNGTLTSDGSKSTIKWFDPKAAPPLHVIDGPAEGRKYGTADVLPWQEKVTSPEGPHVGSFYDNVMAVLRGEGTMRVTPQSVRQVIRVIEMVRQSAGR